MGLKIGTDIQLLLTSRPNQENLLRVLYNYVVMPANINL